MTYKFFLHNNKLLPVKKAAVPLSYIEYSYGFGVYETLRATKGKIHFLDDYCRRLLESAKIIKLAHSFTQQEIRQGVEQLIKANNINSASLKVLLIGGSNANKANLYIICLNPAFPDRKLYKTGAHVITYNYERLWPQAKTLNMLPSYIAYHEAKRAGAYEALFVNKQGHITEGTRTNFLACKGNSIISPPASSILPGITRMRVLEWAASNGLDVVEQDIALDKVKQYDSVFLTGTSSKIMPIKSINQYTWSQQAPVLRQLMSEFNNS